MTSKVLVISGGDVLKCFPMRKAIEIMRSAFSDLSNQVNSIPQRTILQMPHQNADGLVMPIYSSKEKRFSIKVAAINRDNSSNNLPLIHSILMLFNSVTGEPLAIVDAKTITGIRTGAATGLATDLLARRDSSVAAMLLAITALSSAAVNKKYTVTFVINFLWRRLIPNRYSSPP